MPRTSKRTRVSQGDDEDSPPSQRKTVAASKKQKRNAASQSAPIQIDESDDSDSQPVSRTPVARKQTKKKHNKRVAEVDSDSENEGDGENGTSNHRDDEKLSLETKQTLVGMVVRYALFCEAKKLPVKRDEVRKIMKEQNVKGFAVQSLLDDANNILKEMFGMELLPLDKEEAQQQQQQQQGTTKSKRPTTAYKAYIVGFAEQPVAQLILPKHELARRSVAFMDEEQLPSQGLLIVILSLIDMSKQHSHMLDEEVLWQHLEKLGIKRNIVHPELGNVGKLVDQFVKQHYLVKKKKSGSEALAEERGKSALFQYGKGGRTLQEIDQDALLQFTHLLSGFQSASHAGDTVLDGARSSTTIVSDQEDEDDE